MTNEEIRLIYTALKRDCPDYFNKLKTEVQQKRDMILACIKIASNREKIGYQEEVNKLYNTCCSFMNQTETLMLNYICLIKHKEQFCDGDTKGDVDICRWIGYLQKFKDSGNPIIGVLDRHAQKLINQYKLKRPVGRPKGTGKRTFTYNNKEYHTIQECADEYGISKQGMYKKLKKMNVI